MSLGKGIAPNATQLADEIEAEARKNPAQRAQLDSLKSALDRETSGMKLATNMGGIVKLDSLLGSDPAFKSNIRQLALNNPAALEKIIPQALANPSSMQQLVATTAAAQPGLKKTAPQAEAPAGAAPVIKSQVEPAVVVAGGKNPAPEAAAEKPAAAAPGKADTTQTQLQADLVELSKVPGFAELVDRAENNPQLKDMFSALTTGGNPAEAQATVASILKRAGDTPEERLKSTMFTDLVKTIDEKPGVVSSIASSFANDPKTGMMMVGMYSQFNQGFGKMLDGIFGQGALDGIFQGIMQYVGKMLGQSGGLMSMSNNGGGLLNQALGALGATPAQVNQIDPANGAVTSKTGAEFKADADKAAVAAVNGQTGPLAEQQKRNGPNQAPGMQPAGA